MRAEMATHRRTARITVQPALDRLAQLAQLGPDWDSYGGVPPSAEAIATARQLVLGAGELLADTVGQRALPYAVAPLADGCVQLTWRGRFDEIEVEIGPRDSIGYLLIRRQGDDETFDEGERVSASKALELVGRVLLPRGDG
jgi:hypothetical protein